MSIRLLLSLLGFALFSFSASAQDDQIKSLNEHVIDIQTIGDDQKAMLNKFFNSRKIVGLGDATHGTSEFYSKKAELIKYLVTDLNYKVVVIEGYLTDTDVMNNYVMYGEGDIYRAIISIGFQIWYTHEIYDFVEWLRIYNQDLPDDEKVRFYGCDMQAPQTTAKKLKIFLQEKGVLNESLTEGLDWMMTTRAANKLSKEDKKLIKSTVYELDLAFANIPAEKLKNQELILRYKRLLHQFEEYHFANGGYSSSNKRDKFMAENVSFIYTYEGEKKTVVWAHNAHMAKKSGQDKGKPMGSHLSEEFGSDYYAVGFAFNSGTLLGYDMKSKKMAEIPLGEADENSVDHFFSKSSSPVFFLDFESVSKDDVIASYIYKKTTSRQIGAGYYEGQFNRNYKRHVISKSYDAVIFIRDTTPRQMLSWNHLK